MRIVIDGRPLVDRPVGIGTYTIDAIRAICKYIPEWEVILALPGPLHKDVEGLPLDKIKVVVNPLPIKAKRFLWMHLKLPFIARRYKADILWSTNKLLPLFNFGSYKTMITLHDVVWKEFRGTMNSEISIRLSSWFMDNSINKADYVWFNSYYTKRKIEEYFPHLAGKVSIVGDGCNTRFVRLNIKEREKLEIEDTYGVSGGFILFVGSLEPRKNLSFLIKLMPEIYKRTGKKLVIVGARGWKNNSISEIVNSKEFIKESVVFTDFISNELLVKLYNLATCYVSTALNEGFGMPQLEAMSCGCPVITANNSAMTEVAKGRGVLVDGWDEQVWIDTICNTVTNEQKLEELRHPDISEYSWERIIKDVYRYLTVNNK